MLKNMNVVKTLNTMYEKLGEMGYEVLWISAFGSWNYDVAYEGSDIDAKAVVAPKLKDIVYNSNPTSTKVKFDEGEVDVKDVRLFLDLSLRQNPAYIEGYYTPYKVVNPKYFLLVEKLFGLDIAYYDKRKALHAIAGVAKQKLVALDKPYPSKLELIDKFGVDPKQAHHLFRLYNLMKKYMKDLPYEDVINESKNRDFLVKIKTGEVGWTKDEFFKYSKRAYKLIEDAVTKWTEENKDYEPNEEIANTVSEMKLKIVEKALRDELA